VLGELPLLPHLPELPARGPGADLTGRTAGGLLADLHVDLQPGGWRLVPRASVDERRARSLLAQDLDALEEHAAGYTGPLKLQVAGPWTLAATVDLPRGEKVLVDAGAVRDIAAALGEGVRAHVDAVRRRVPGATVLVQYDEPSLPAVLAARVPTASGFATLRAVDPVVATNVLRSVIEATDALPVLHCCAADVPVRLLVAAGAKALSLDATRLTPEDDEPLGEAVDAGVALFLGVLAAVGPEVSQVPRSVSVVRDLWRRVGPPGELGSRVVVTPTCGMAGATPEHAWATMAALREVARRADEEDAA
jgi:methionine synthase II (cobalamin-independent)